MTKIESFNPNRLRFARKRRGLTLVALGKALGRTSKSISDYENDRREPKDSFIDSVSSYLKFPKGFFYKDDIPTIDGTAVSFRSLARMPASVRESSICAGQIALEFSSWIDKKFNLPSTNIPDFVGFEPEAAAESLRNEWGLGERTISNMVHLLESKGVRVFSLSEDTHDMDAFSFWMDKNPFIFLNSKKSVERSRFDAAHELGHILLHKHGAPQGKEAESQANAFASAFLMPQGSVISNAPKFITLSNILTLKYIWKVAAAALVRRLKDLFLLTEWSYRSLIIEMSKRGYMKNEPMPITKRETSKLLPMVFKALRDDGIRREDIARDLCVYSNEIDSLLFNLTIVGLNGGSTKKAEDKKAHRGNNLRIVK